MRRFIPCLLPARLGVPTVALRIEGLTAATSTVWRLLGSGALVGLILIVFGVRQRTDLYSCHLCRSLKVVETSSFIVWPINREESLSKQGATGPDHIHQWWKYSYAYEDGLGGWLGGGIGCRTDGIYRDEQHR